MAIMLDYRDHKHPILVCTTCKVSEPLPLPISIPALSAVVRDCQFRHATCWQERKPSVRWSETQA